MSYHHRRRARAPRVRHQPMSGWLDTLITVIAPGPALIGTQVASGGSDAECAAARRSAEAKLDAQTAEMSAAWKPTGYYAVADMARLRDQVMALCANASNAIDNAVSGHLISPTNLREAQGKLQQAMKDSLPFTNAINLALERRVRVIDAPGFKRWVVDAMNKATICYGQIAWENCARPAFASWLDSFMRAFANVVAVAKAMVKVTIALGEEIVKVSGWLVALLPFAKYGAAAYLVYLLVRKKKATAGG